MASPRRITDIRQMFPSEYICHADLIDAKGQRRTLAVTIDRVEQENVIADGGRKSPKWVMHFRKMSNGYEPKPLVLNVTNGIAIASVHGQDPAQWPGKAIELYVGESKAVAKWRPVYGDKMPCIRIRGRSVQAEEMKEELAQKQVEAFEGEGEQ